MLGGLSHDVRREHDLSLERQQTFISFLDLAAGMLQCSGRGGEVGREACECGFERGCESKNRLVLVHLARKRIVVSCIPIAVWLAALRMGG